MTMIALSSYSTSWCQNDISSKGVVEQNDSLVLVPVSALRIANMKMTELKYEKEINANLRQIVSNDSIIIKDLKDINTNIQKDAHKYKKQRNLVSYFGAGLASVLTLLLIFK